MKKAIIVISGGMDSTTALYKALDDGYKCFAISFNYGQKHKKELDYAKMICQQNNINHQIIDLTSISKLINNSSLTNENIAVPEGHYAQENMKSTVVPNRNMIMYSIASGYAINIGAEAIYVGVHSGDHFIYPDCRKEFIELLEKTIQSGTDSKIKVIAPFINVGKEEIVKIGTKLGVPFDLTWSCYKGGKLHCGKCGTCVERKEAFKLAKVKDITKYIE